jgi:hypothetical protein
VIGRASSLAVPLAALVSMAPVACDNAECGGYCGPGTHCVDRRCIVTTPRVTDEPEPVEVDTDAPKRRRKGRKHKGGADDPGVMSPSEAPLDDDSDVPSFDSKADRNIDLKAGSERLGDAVVDRELAKLDPAFQRCVEKAAARSETELGAATVRFTLGIGNDGRVSGVNVRAPAPLPSLGLVACVRKAIHAHRFPGFDGPSMSAKSSFSI